RSQFHTQQLTLFSRSQNYQLQFFKSSLQSNRHQTAESLANHESCKFSELLLSTLKVFPYFTIVIDTSGAEADGYFSRIYFCNESPGANSKTAGSKSSGGAEACWSHNPEVDGSKPSSARQAPTAENAMNPGIVGSSPIWGEIKQSGAAEACWAHNPEVDGSKPSSARQTHTAENSMNCRSEEHTSELQSHLNLVCRLLLEKKTQVLVESRSEPCAKLELNKVLRVSH